MRHSLSVAGVAMALGGAFFYGFNISFAALAAQDGVSGPVLVAYRIVTMMVLAIAAHALLRTAFHIPKGDRAGVILIGLTSIGVGVGYLSAVAFIPVTVAAVIFYTFPILIVIATPFIDKRPLTPTMLFVTILAFTGVVMVVGPAIDALDWRGIVLAFVASISAAIQFFAGTRCRNTSLQSKILGVQIVALPFTLMIAMVAGGMKPPSVLLNSPLAVGLTIGGFMLGFLFQMLALNRIPASAAGLAFCAEPVVAAITSVLVLNERLGPLQYAGGALVIAAIMLNVVFENRRATAITKIVPE
ncbi:DMT family transporter [Rhizobiales bacterium TNE-4]|nr:DMT family transporter [Rhizobiales bacterium TNE-4]MBV1827912.1 DMT family transporter [Rhizobiales bacterium TNE-4]